MSLPTFPIPNRPHISHSQLGSWTCQTRGILRYVLNKDTDAEAPAADAGKAVHEALKSWFLGQGYDIAMSILDAQYRQYALERYTDDHRLSWSNVSEIMGHWFATHPVSSFPFKVLPQFIEEPIRVPSWFNEEVDVAAVVDLVGETPGGQYVVIDHKTTYRMSEGFQRQWVLDPQLSLYVDVVSTTLKKPVHQFQAFINAIELSRLPLATTKTRCKTHALPFAECRLLHAKSAMLGPVWRTEEQIREWHQTASALYYRSQAWAESRDRCDPAEHWTLPSITPQEGLYTGACTWCSFFDYCGQGRTKEAYDNLLRTRTPSPVALMQPETEEEVAW